MCALRRIILVSSCVCSACCHHFVFCNVFCQFDVALASIPCELLSLISNVCSAFASLLSLYSFWLCLFGMCSLFAFSVCTIDVYDFVVVWRNLSVVSLHLLCCSHYSEIALSVFVISRPPLHTVCGGHSVLLGGFRRGGFQCVFGGVSCIVESRCVD